MPSPDLHPGLLPFLRRNRRGIRLLLVGLGVFLGSALLACADDFLTDPTRLEDGLRTGGWATVIAGTAATVVSVLVNGSVILQTTLNNPGEDEGEEGADPTKWQFDVRTEEGRTELVPDGEDMLWIYGRVLCNKPEKRPELITRAIRFSVSGTHSDWVQLGRPAMKGGAKVVRVRAKPPTEDAELTDEKVTINVMATIEGQAMTAPVELTLDAKDYIVELEFKGVWA